MSTDKTAEEYLMTVVFSDEECQGYIDGVCGTMPMPEADGAAMVAIMGMLCGRSLQGQPPEVKLAVGVAVALSYRARAQRAEAALAQAMLGATVH